MSSEEAAKAAAEEVNLFVRLADLEQQYVDLEQKRQELFLKAQSGDERIASLQQEKETFQATISELKDDLSAAIAELRMEKSSKEEAKALATATQERASRVEAEADNLREEIRYVSGGGSNCLHSLTFDLICSHANLQQQSLDRNEQDVANSGVIDGGPTQAG